MLFDTLFIVFHLSASAAALAAASIPPLSAFLGYGKTLPLRSPLLARITVPKDWFWHFYIELAALLIFSTCWKHEFRMRQVLLLIHALRRTYEQFFVFKPNKRSRMHLAHYFVGLMFYFFQAFTEGHFGETHLASIRLAIFFVASLGQYLTHLELSRTQKYRLPEEFKRFSVSDPHYAAEIAIYSVLPYDKLSNHLATLFWVVINLAVSARQQRKYYNAHGYSVHWCLLPYVF